MAVNRQVNSVEARASRVWRTVAAASAITAMAVFCDGCSKYKALPELVSPYPGAMTVAVAPFRNLSGTNDTDVMSVTDEFFTELQQVKGLEVMPVNRVLSTLQELRLENVSNPDEVLALAQSLGVDAVIVGSITRYNAYPPPEVGVVAQLYLREKSERHEVQSYVNPGELARSGQPIQLGAATMIKPTAMVVRIFDARQNEVKERIERYAKSRTLSKTPYGWKWYMTRRNYLRYVSYEVIGELLSQEQARMGVPAEEKQNENTKGNIAGEGR